MAERILIAEDQLHVRKLIEVKLKALGYDIVAVEDGQVAYEKAIALLPDLILLDVMMPMMTGFEVLSRLKQHPEAKKIPVIMVTAQSKEDEILRGLELGAEDYISKPFSPNELAARVKKVLATHPGTPRRGRDGIIGRVPRMSTPGCGHSRRRFGDPPAQSVGQPA